MNQEGMTVLLSLPYLSEVVTNQALTEGAIKETDTIIVKSIEFDETKKIYLADCDIYKETIH